jgi:hypothetical protein
MEVRQLQQILLGLEAKSKEWLFMSWILSVTAHSRAQQYS